MADNRAIVILGMHRSGTSAVTRGMTTLGVYLGEDLLGALPDNPTGFWEDRDVLELCERALALRRMSSVSVRFPREPEDLAAPLDDLAAEAAELLGRRFGSRPLWGFKNPRTARLLPFWQAVFRRLDVEDSYVIVNRNPLSVARSLEVRNGIPSVKSHLLWLQHAVAALEHTIGKPRVAVDYDDFMNDPVRHLDRVVSALAIDVDPETRQRATEEYVDGFLVPELRHTLFTIEDLDADPSVPGFVKRLYRYTQLAVRDELGLEAPEFVDYVRTVSDVLETMDPVFAFLEQREHELVVAQSETSAQVQRISELQQRLDAADHRSENLLVAQFSGLQSALEARSQQLATLQATVDAWSVQMDATAARLQAYADGLAAVKGESARMDAAVTALRSSLNETEQRLALAQHTFEARGVQLDAVEARLRESTGALAEQQTRLAMQNAIVDEQALAIARLVADTAVREETVSTLNGRAESLEAETSRLTSRMQVLEDAHALAREAMARQDEQLSLLRSQTSQRERDNAALTEALKVKDAELLSIQRSLSWRMTAPLRALRRSPSPAAAPRVEPDPHSGTTETAADPSLDKTQRDPHSPASPVEN